MARPVSALVFFALACLARAAQQPAPAYIKQCQLSSPKLEECLKESLHHIRPYIAKGIPEIQFAAVEPFSIDSLTLALSGGDTGYKITLRDIKVYGLTGYMAEGIKLSNGNQPFEGKFKLPKLQIEANYTSSGKLLVIPASGGGLFHCTIGNAVAVLRGNAKKVTKKGNDYLTVDKLDLDITSIKEIKMHVSKVKNNNKVLMEATNLFLQENGREVMDIMMPQLKVKMAGFVKKIVNQFLSRTSVQTIVKP